MMQGRIDTSFQTVQSDMFASGMAAKIGVAAFSVWLAIKAHADHKTGESWPGMRRIAELTGLSLGAVSNAVRTLIAVRLLRVLEVGRGHRGSHYIARERMDVRLGDRVLCTIVIDYVPETLRASLKEVKAAIKTGKASKAMAACEIIPGDGFTWDQKAGVLTAQIPADDIPPAEPLDELQYALAQRVLAIKKKVTN